MSVKQIVVNCDDVEGVTNALNLLCKETGYFCYNPTNLVEVLTSLSWAETLQFIVDVECVNDDKCAFNILNSFTETLDLAAKHSYIFVINIDSIRDSLNKLKVLSSYSLTIGHHLSP